MRTGKTEPPFEKFVRWLGVTPGQVLNWRTRYGKTNEHNAPFRVTARSRIGSASDHRLAHFAVHYS